MGGREAKQRRKQSHLAKSFLDKLYNYKIKNIHKSGMEEVINK